MEIDELAKIAIENTQKCYQLLKETGLDKSVYNICKNFTTWFIRLFKGRSKEKTKYLNKTKVSDEVRDKINQLQGVLEEMLFDNKELREELISKIEELNKHKVIERYSISVDGNYNIVIKDVTKTNIKITNK